MNSTPKHERNYAIEERIRINLETNKKYGINVYGGMGMDGNSPEVIKQKHEELNYIKTHPELYPPYKR